MAVAVFSNDASTTVARGGTSAPAPGTAETWKVAEPATFPLASSSAHPPVSFHVCDPARPSEKILVTDTSGPVWSVVRGDEGTVPVRHAYRFTVVQTVTAKELAAMQDSALDLVHQFGADNTGVADSTAALAAAIAALPPGGGTIRVRAGTYTMNAAQLSAVNGLHLIGDGFGSTVINCTAGGSYFMNLDPPGYSQSVHIEDLQIRGLTIHAIAGMDIFWGANIVRSKIVDNFLRQSDPGFAIMNVSPLTGTNGTTYIAECEFANKEFVGGAPRTIEAWHLDFTGPGLRCNDTVWHGGGYKIWAAIGGDTAMYWMKLIGDEAGKAGSRHNVWRDLVFEIENGVGGLINLQQTRLALLDNISSEDLDGKPVGHPLILFNSVDGGAEGVQLSTIRNYSRRSGANITNLNCDIKLDSNCKQITIDSPVQDSGGTRLTIDLGGATNIVRSGSWPRSYTLLNSSGIAPARAAFQPANPVPTSSTTSVMMGLGRTISFTPQGSGQVQVILNGQALTSAGPVPVSVGGWYGTGSAPANGVAATGTRFGRTADLTVQPAGTAGGAGFGLTDIILLTPGTTYWFDLAVSTSDAAGPAAVADICISLLELS